MKFFLALVVATLASAVSAQPREIQTRSSAGDPAHVQFVLTKTINGESTVLASQLVEVNDLNPPVSTGTFNYVQTCALIKYKDGRQDKAECYNHNSPTGLTAAVTNAVNSDGNKVYSVRAQFHELIRINESMDGTNPELKIQLPQANIFIFEQEMALSPNQRQTVSKPTMAKNDAGQTAIYRLRAELM